MSANDRLMRSLPHLQNLIKRDPEAYREDVSELPEVTDGRRRLVLSVQIAISSFRKSISRTDRQTRRLEQVSLGEHFLRLSSSLFSSVFCSSSLVSGRPLLSRGDEESLSNVSRRSSFVLDRVEHRHSAGDRSRLDSDAESRIDRMSSVV